MNFGSTNLSSFHTSMTNSMNNKNMMTLKNIISKTYKIDRKIDLDPSSPKSNSNTNSMVSSSLAGGPLSSKSSTA